MSLAVKHAHQSLNVIKEASCGLEVLHVDSVDLRRLVLFKCPNGVHHSISISLFLVCFVTATIII